MLNLKVLFCNWNRQDLFVYFAAKLSIGSMKIFNTLSKKKEEFVPLEPNKISMYVCGPTVYDYFHIGNARSFIMADIIRRYLIYKGYHVKYVMNLTDIDDKIIKKSLEEKISADLVAKKYIEAFFEDCTKLKMKIADVHPQATQHMDEIIHLIQKLVDKGIAYQVNGDVFYDVSKFNLYGKLSGKKIDELESGARVEINEIKKNPLDFSLWKAAKEGEPFWESPWGNGRPGWHIECSAMSTAHLNETIDIHAGGTDLIFPHHENEIAQSEAAYGKQFVRYWIHFGFLNIKEEKMSKSLGNFFTAREILSKYSAEAVRLFFIQSHYRGPLNYSDELLEASEKGLAKLKNLFDLLIEKQKSVDESYAYPDLDIKRYYAEFEKAMDDDFNSPQAVAVLFDFIRDVNTVLAESINVNSRFISDIKDFLYATAEDVFGIAESQQNKPEHFSKLADDLLNLLLDIRIKLKQQKNYELADDIRNKLSGLGVTLKDSKTGTTYKFVK